MGRNRDWWKMEEVFQEQEARQGRGQHELALRLDTWIPILGRSHAGLP